MPIFLPPTILLSGHKSLFRIISDAGLTANLKVCLDAGDSASYPGSGQTWFDRSGNGYDFFLGADGNATATDPTFNGSAGGLSSAEYFSLDGGDYFRYHGANEPWMQNLHKNGAVFTLMMMVYLPSMSGRPWGTTGNALGAGAEINLGIGGAPRTQVYNASGNVLDKQASTAPNSNAWNMLGLSIDENSGNVSFHYLNGSFNQVSASNTFDANYSSPASGNANFTMEIGACGNGLRWSRLFEQPFRVDKWSLCRG